MRFLLILMVSFLTFAFLSCKNSRNEIGKAILKMQARHVSIPFYKMSCWINDSIQEYRPWEKAELKLVVYTDSGACSQCTLKKMYLWKDFVDLERKYNGQFYIFFIIQSGSNSTYSLVSNLHHTELNHPIYIDSTNAFTKRNPHIPSESIFHVFLLDKRDSVILVGNPLFNNQIEDMLRGKVDEILKEKIMPKNSNRI